MAAEPVHDKTGKGELSSSTPLGAFNSLAISNFRTLLIGSLFSMAAMQINIVARSWLAYNISGSALTLGIVAIARGLPSITLSPIAGVVADRFDKRNILLLSLTCMSVFSLVNAILVHLDIIQVWHLVAIGLFQGIIFPFTVPARQAYIPELVGRNDLPNALAMDSTGKNLNRVLAPSLAGILIAWHPVVAFYTISFFYFLSVLTLISLPSHKFSAASKMGPIEEMFVGFRYIIHHSVLPIFFALGFLAIFLGMPFQQLLPVFQQEVLRVGPVMLGFMYAAVGVGAVLGSLIVAYLSDDPRRGLFQIIAGIGFGLSLILFANSRTYWISLILLAGAGITSQGYLIFNRMLILLNTDKALYGRVIGVYMMTWSTMPIALLPMGALVDLIGAPITVVGGGAMLIFSIIIVSLIRPDIWTKDKSGL